MHRFSLFLLFSACMLFTSCNKDEVITEEVGGQPIIELDSETGIYTVKVDHELTIAPTYQNVEDALFAWTIDGTLVSSGPSLQRTWNECGDFYVKLRVDNAEGYAEEELKVEVKELTPPVISLALPSQGLKSRPEYRLHIYSRYSAFGCRRVQKSNGYGKEKSFPPRILILSMKKNSVFIR